jgi:hypothetical protein
VRSKSPLWAVLPLALLLIGAAQPRAAANVLCDLGVSDKSGGQFGKQIFVGAGQKFFIRVAVMNTSLSSVVSVCDIPGLKVRVGNTVMPWSVRTVLMPRQVAGTTIAAACPSPGSFKTTVLVRFLSPFTGRVHEVADTVSIVAVGPDDKKTDGTGGLGGKGDKTNGGTSPIGELGTGGQQSGGLGGQQSGGTGGQGGQTGGTGGKDDKTGGTGGKGDKTGGTGGQGSQGGQSGGLGGTGSTGGTGGTGGGLGTGYGAL